MEFHNSCDVRDICVVSMENKKYYYNSMQKYNRQGNWLNKITTQ